MLFNSYEFLFVFLPVTLAGCFLLARFAGAQARAALAYRGIDLFLRQLEFAVFAAFGG